MDVAQHAATIAIAQRNEGADRVERRRDISGLLRHQLDAVGRRVGCEDHAEAIDDGPARRRQEADIDAIFVRERGIAISLHDLQKIHASGQCAEQPDLRAGEQDGPAGQHTRAKDLTLHSHASTRQH
jgi:hypothetical protein